MRILGIDPGDKNIGVALSDPTGTIANPLTLVAHVSRPIDAATIAQLARENNVSKIILGQSFDLDGKPNFQGRKAARLAAAIRTQTEIPVELWDEAYSTQQARGARIAMGTTQSKRKGHLDELAATVILQSYLDSKPQTAGNDPAQ
ncbi:MAG: Holliday junction resolvase RuvX [Anaerolineales bacterium]